VGALNKQSNKDFWTGKKVLVTGHTGFKGSWLTYWLKINGAVVCGLSLNPITSPALWDELKMDLNGFDIRADIRGVDWVEKVAEFRPEFVFHLAAQPLVVTGWKQPLLTFDTNVTGTANLLSELNLMDSVKNILVVTTDKVYKLDEQKINRKEDDELGGKDPYAASKAAVEFLVASWPIREDINIATARSGNVIGGGDWSEDRLIPDIIRAGLAKTQLEIRYPTAIRPWQHVIEPIFGYLLLAQAMHTKSCTAPAINFGPLIENQITVEDIVAYSSEVLPHEFQFNKALTPGKYIESEFLLLDSALAKDELDWQPILSWTEAVQLSLNWYVDFQNGTPVGELIERDIDYYLSKFRKE
jgi:CDP-glucose 4,6-dehydratase